MDRFWTKVEKSESCWIWTRCKTAAGYGQFHLNGKALYAHRYSYESLVGPIPEGLDLDHLCRNRSCVNPSHLEPVTRAENLYRGIGFAATRKVQTHCKSGHEFTPDNIYWARGGKTRMCATCQRGWQKKYREQRLNRAAISNEQEHAP